MELIRFTINFALKKKRLPSFDIVMSRYLYRRPSLEAVGGCRAYKKFRKFKKNPQCLPRRTKIWDEYFFFTEIAKNHFAPPQEVTIFF